MVMKYIFYFLLSLSFATSVYAHPVTYQGSMAYMSWNGPMMSDQWLTYSPTARFALTARYLSLTDLREERDKREFYFPQANFLVKRWNGVGSQANIYLSGAWGIEKRKNTEFTAGLGAIEADWETRKHYLSAKYQVIGGGLEYARVRAGFAPYVGGYSDLHTWVILQAEHLPEYLGSTQITPVLRFFKNNILWEVGASLNGQWAFNFMVHF